MDIEQQVRRVVPDRFESLVSGVRFGQFVSVGVVGAISDNTVLAVLGLAFGVSDMWAKAAGVETAIVVTKTLTLLLGGLITYLALKAYRRTGSPSLRALTIGFGIVTVGSLLAGVVDVAFESGFQMGLLIQSSLIAVGFAVIVYSLYGTRA